MAGLNDRRILGTESGRIRRAARQVERAGGNPSALLNRAAEVKLGEGSAISSSEDNVAFEEKKRRMQSGLLESKRRALLNPAGTPRPGMTPVERAEGGTQKSVPQSAGTAPSQTGTAPQPSLTAAPPSLMDSAAAADSRSLSRRKEMRAAEDAITGGEPGNLAGLANRDTQDRAAAVTAARTESAGNPSVTRQGVIDRINKERTAKGLQPFGEDIYKDIAAQGIAESDKARADARSKAGFEATGFGAEFASPRTPLQKSLIEAKTRFAPPPVEEPQFAASEAERQRARDDAAKEKARQDGAAMLATSKRGLTGRFGSQWEGKGTAANPLSAVGGRGSVMNTPTRVNPEDTIPAAAGRLMRKTGGLLGGAWTELNRKPTGRSL